MTKSSKTRREQRLKKRRPPASAGLARADDVKAAFEKTSNSLQQLSDNQEKLGKLFNHNLANINNAFSLTDTHQQIMRRVMNDLTKDVFDILMDPDLEGSRQSGRLFLRVDEEGNIDYAWYAEQHAMCMYALDFFIRLASLGTAPREDEERESEPSGPTNEAVFGGDYVPHQDRP